MEDIFSSDYQDFSYWFSDTITDPKGNNVSDINKGIKRLFTDLVDQLNNLDNQHSKFFINEGQDGQPDSAAYIKYSNENLWWYMCLSNCLENPFKDFVHDKIFYAFEKTILTNHAKTESNSTTKDNTESKIDKIIELN